MQMKKTVFRKLNFLIAIGSIFAALALGGCENLLSSTSSSDDSAPVNFIPPAGNVENGYGIIHGILPQETSASTRSAIPDVPTISSYRVFAQNGITTIEANVDNASKTFSISLPYGTWNVTANGLLANGRVVYTQTQKNIAVSAANPTVELKFNLSYSTNPEDGEGTISLTVKFPASGAASTIAGIECTLTKGGSKITVPVLQADLQAGTFKIEHITEDLGTYSLTIQCYGDFNNLVYRIDEIVNVYANLTTDKFVGSAPYISGGEINITQAMLDEFQQTTLYVNATSGDDNNTGTQFDPLRTFNRAVELVNNSTRPPATEFRIFLQSDVVDGAELELNAGKKLTVASAGNTSTITSLGRAFTVAATSELTVQSVQFQKLRFVVEGTFAMNEGKISGNELDGNGGAIYIKAGGEATITGGEISNNKATLSGGGIYNEGGTLKISGGTKIIDCTSGSIGGGIYNDDASATATITDCDIIGCTSITGGGSIGNAYGTLTVTRGSIERSSARVGGGIWNASNGTLIIDGTTITDCEAKHQGGGIYTSGNSPNKIKDCIITSCTVSETASGNGGGGIYIYKNGMLEITGGTIERCTAPHNGGGIYNAGGTVGAPVAITGVTIIGGGDIDNLDANNGGGIYNTENGTLTIDGGTTIADCTSGVGGGIYNTDGSTLTVNSTTITGCKSKSGGGGIYNGGSSSTVSVATVTDCTIESCTTRNMNGGGICNGGTLTVTGGSISNSSASLGGGISLGGTFTISGVTIENCTARGWGGGIYTSGYDESSKIENCTINGCSVTGKNLDGSNISDNGGGGIANNSGGKTLTVIGGQITGCRAATYGGGIYIVTGNLAISDLTITGGGNVNELDALHGGGISAYYRSSLTMTDCEIKNCTARNGGAVAGADTLTMDGGTISDNIANESGGGVYVYNGTFTMNDGTISDNIANESGGGVYVYNGTFTMNDGTISDNIANESGGGVYVYNGTFTMNDGTISGNISRGTTEGSFGGGGIFIYHSTASANGGVFTMTGGTVSGNEAVYGGGIWGSNFSEISLEGGTFSGNTAATSGQGAYVSPGCTFKMSGAASLVSNNGDNDVYLHGVKNSSTGAVMSYATICVAGALTATSPVATITPAIYEADQAVLSADTGLTITPTICSSFAMSSAPAGIAPDGTGTKGILKYSTFYVRGTGAGWYAENPGYTAAVGNDTTGNGSKAKPFATIQKAIETAFAMNDGASEYTIYVDGTITGGATATANGMGDITPTKALNLKIQSMSATTNATLDAESSGRVLNINANAAVTLKNVNITNGTTADNGGGIYNEGSLTIEGGAITNCTTAEGKGGGIYNSGTLTMEGGSITNCTANTSTVNGGWGGGIYNEVTDASITCTLTDCTITGCKATDGSSYGWGGGICNYAGTLKLTNVNITGGGDTANQDVSFGGGVWNAGSLTITGGTIKNCVSGINGGGGGICTNGTLTCTGVTIENCITRSLRGGGILIRDSSVIATLTDCTITGCKTLDTGSIDYRDGGGGINNYGGTLTLSGGIITGCSSEKGGGIFTIGGELVITGGAEISGNKTEGSIIEVFGGGIYIQSGNVTLENGTISDNEADWGGGVYVNQSGTLTMNGGTISGNAAKSGGGISIRCTSGTGNVTITGGTITNNTASEYGGGVYNLGTLIQNGGEISNNTASSGGGVYNSTTYIINGTTYNDCKGTFTMDGGTISSNTAIVGGGIYNNVTDASITTTLTNCEITGCKVTGTGQGGGIYNLAGTLELSGVTITGGNSTASPDATEGGGIYNSAGCALTIKDSTTISACVARTAGGGVWNAGTLTMQSGAKIENNTVVGNTTTGDGGGVYNYSNGTFRMSGGSISRNTARYGGGVQNRGMFAMSGGSSTISGNTATGNANSGGGGIHLYGGTFGMTGGTVSGNNATGTTDDSGGGGIYAIVGSRFGMSGGTFSGNTAQNGNGAFVAEGSTMEMGGSASFADDNDVYLSDNTTTTAVPTIQIVNALTGTTPVATITPSAYAVGKQVLSAGAGITITQAICKQFALSPDPAGTEWKLAPDSTGAYGVLGNSTFYVRGTGNGWYTENSAYTAAAGNDTTGDGSKPKPFLSLQKAIDSVTAMNDGTSEYTIYVDGTIKREATWAGWVGTISPGTSLKLKIESMSATTNATLDGEEGSVSAVRGLYIDGSAVEVTLINVNIKNCYYPAVGAGVFVIKGTVTITGGTISNCHMVSSTSSTADGGGAIYNSYGSLTVSHTTISDCTSTSCGGGICMYDGNTTLNDVTISNCSATNSGGGIYNYSRAELTIIGGSIEGCTTTSMDSATGGGGIYNLGSVTAQNVTISDCTSMRSGGGIYVYGGTLSFDGGEISGCKTIGTAASNGSGGGICINGGTTVDVSNCDIKSCSANASGGGIWNAGTLKVSTVAFTTCSASNKGGGICNASGTVTDVNVTYIGCTASNGNNTSGF